MGLRDIGDAIPFDFPEGLDFECPICGCIEGLDWSEYHALIWCPKCNKDYPSCFCKEDMDEKIKLFLEVVEEYKNDVYKNHTK